MLDKDGNKEFSSYQCSQKASAKMWAYRHFHSKLLITHTNKAYLPKPLPVKQLLQKNYTLRNFPKLGKCVLKN